MSTYYDRLKDLKTISNYSSVNDADIQTREVMREETELIVKKERTIHNILAVTTIVTILFTIKYTQT